MAEFFQIRTKRLLLRQWNDEDVVQFAKLNADPVVMEYYPNVLTIEQSNAMAEKLKSLISDNGWGFWAVEILENQSFIGFVGLHNPSYELPVTPCTEIGWRLAKEYWGKGYATEAAKACLDFGFKELNLSEIYSFTSVANKRSRGVMERINMKNENKNFEHPMIPMGNPLREHVLYKVSRHNE